MKKYVTIGFMVLSIGIAKGQEVKFGVKGGLNFMNISGNQGSGTGKVGFHVGGLVEFKLSEKFAIQPELLYSTKGTKQNFYGIELKTNLSYIDLPIMAKFFVTKGLSLEAGPQIGYLVSESGVSSSELAVYQPGYYKKMDYGMNLGAGYVLESGLMFQMRYYIGLADISKIDPYSNIDTKDHNNGFQLSVGYQF
jgi:hypothetical protein